MAPDDLTLDDAFVTEGSQWKYYVDSFVLEQPTEGLPMEVHAPVLQR